MPANVVSTSRDEELWDKAKLLARKQYAKVKEGSKRFWRIVMGIYKQSKGEKSMFASYPFLQEAMMKAKVAHRKVGTGELSETTRKQIGRVGEKKREDMPAHVFLLGAERKYPVKVKQNGKWVYSLKLLLAAARRARMQGRKDLASRADSIRERLQKKEKSLMAIDYPAMEKARVKAHQRSTKTGKLVQVGEHERTGRVGQTPRVKAKIDELSKLSLGKLRALQDRVAKEKRENYQQWQKAKGKRKKELESEGENLDLTERILTRAVHKKVFGKSIVITRRPAIA